MSECNRTEDDSTDAAGHPATKAWSIIRNGHAQASHVEILQEEKQRSVYRICDGKLSVIAKRCQRDEAQREHLFYESVLPDLAFPTLRSYGFVEDDTGDFAWLFVEDAGGEEFCSTDKEHRRLAGEWLALLHSSSVASVKASNLNDKGPNRFLPYLQSARHVIQENLSNPLLNDDDKFVLNTIITQCQVVEANRSELEQFCGQMPQTIVHGDFKEDNMRVLVGSNDRALLVFDWNEGGWGIPALDLAKFLGYSVNPDIDAYCSVVQRRWPFLDKETVWRLAFVGEVFRCAISIRWEAEKLRYDWVEGPMENLKTFKGWLDDVVVAEPWREYATHGKACRRIKSRHWK